jgi:hypothetical protein
MVLAKDGKGLYVIYQVGVTGKCLSCFMLIRFPPTARKC